MVRHLLNFLQDDVLIKDYGLIGGNPVDYYQSVWVTKGKYKYAYAIMESPIHFEFDDDYAPLSLEDCEKWMSYWIEQGAVSLIKESN